MLASSLPSVTGVPKACTYARNWRIIIIMISSLNSSRPGGVSRSVRAIGAARVPTCLPQIFSISNTHTRRVLTERDASRYLLKISLLRAVVRCKYRIGLAGTCRR